MDPELETAEAPETAAALPPESPQADHMDSPLMLTDAMCGCACQLKGEAPLA